MQKKSVFVKRIISGVLVASFIAGAACLSGCSEGDVSREIRYFFGSPVEIVFTGTQKKADRDKLCGEIKSALNKAESSLSATVEGSSVDYFNTAPCESMINVDEYFYEAYRAAKEVYDISGGAFDPTSAMLTDLWGFSSRHYEKIFTVKYDYDRARNDDGSFPLPDERYISAFKKLADLSKTSVEQNEYGDFTAYKNVAPVTVDGVTYQSKIDLAGVAKGYAADLSAALIAKSGLKGAYISFGGSSLYLADNAGGNWGLGIVDPFSGLRKTFARIEVKDKFVSTSGVYERRYYLDGEEYHHIVDVKTGAPSKSDLVSATVVTKCGAFGDALATALVVLGKEESLKLLKTIDCGFVLVSRDKRVYSNLSVTLFDSSFALVGSDG